ncbi:MAG: ABC transporter permease, partial [Anaerolineales bacterium]|nr:ABC transporter permease [Anaerolineales bacterium]
MLSYIARRILYMVIMVILVSFVSFLIIELPPGDFLTQKLEQLQARGDRSAAQRIDEYRARYKLDQPVLTRYWNWITHFVEGDFGESFQFERPVKEVIGQRALMTVILSLATITLVWCLAIPIGVYSATHQYSLGDQVVTTMSFLGLGMPGFLLALLVLFFAMMVLKVEVGGLFSREFIDAPWNWAKVVDLLKHLWIPALISSVTGTAGLVRIMRGNLLETLGQPFVEAARARGLKEGKVTWKHAVRVAINPLIV